MGSRKRARGGLLAPPPDGGCPRRRRTTLRWVGTLLKMTPFELHLIVIILAVNTAIAVTDERRNTSRTPTYRTPSNYEAPPSSRQQAALDIDAVVLPFGPGPVDNGGFITTYIENVRHANRTGTELRLTGTCVSACTIYLGARYVCVAPEARFWFHAAYDTYSGKVSADATTMMASYWPGPVQGWAKVVGATGSTAFTMRRSLTGADLIRLGVRRCVEPTTS